MAKYDSVYWAFTKSITSMLPRTNHESEMTSAKWVTARKPQIYCGAGERLNQISEVTAVVMTSAWQHRRNHTNQVLWYTFGCQTKKKIKGNLSSGVFFLSITFFFNEFWLQIEWNCQQCRQLHQRLTFPSLGSSAKSWTLCATMETKCLFLFLKYSSLCLTSWLNSNKWG